MTDAAPGAAASSAANLLSVGLNQDSVDPDLGARLFMDEPDPAAIHRRLSEAGLQDMFALATCERIEVFSLTAESAPPETVFAILARETGAEARDLRGQSRLRRGEDALAHLFSIAAALDSQVVGEPQILGQVRESHRQAAELGLVGADLEACLQAAYVAAKRVRTETDIGRYPVSIAAAALLVARDVHGDLTRARAALIGLGEMGEFMGAELKSAGVRDIAVLHPAMARAQAAAQRLGCNYRPWDELGEALTGADIVVAALGAGRFSVTARQAEDALRARRRAPMYFIDAAIPHDVEPSVNDLDGAFVYDLEDLERIALSGRASRESAIEAAREILSEELKNFARRQAVRGAAPSVVALRRHFEEARDAILANGTLDAQEATRRLINRLLHDPTVVLREAAAGAKRRPEQLEAAVKELFRLNGDCDSPHSKPDGSDGEDR